MHNEIHTIPTHKLSMGNLWSLT